MDAPGEGSDRKMKTKITFVYVLLIALLIPADGASPFKKLSGNRLVHLPSNIVFPAKIGLFNRIDTHVYGSGGRDISARYQLDAFIVGDVYIYPVGTYAPDLNGEFRVQENAIREKNKNVKLVAETTIQISQNDRTVTGRKATYDLVRGLFGEPPHQCGSQLIVFRDGPWFVAYRFSYPSERSAIAIKHVADFREQWQWREQ
jgi:hypothetical protein